MKDPREWIVVRILKSIRESRCAAYQLRADLIEERPDRPVHDRELERYLIEMGREAWIVGSWQWVSDRAGDMLSITFLTLTQRGRDVLALGIEKSREID